MTDSNLTEIVVVLDRSGSMASIRADMEGGFEAFRAEQAKLPGRCVLSLYQFDSLFESVYEERPIADVPRLVLEPRGSTALLSACLQSVSLVGRRLRAKPEHERPGKVVVIVITDGHENASGPEYTADMVRRTFEHQREKYGWQFVYLGANVDAFAESSALGMGSSHMAFSSDAQGVGRMYGAVGNAVRSYRSSGQAITSAALHAGANKANGHSEGEP